MRVNQSEPGSPACQQVDSEPPISLQPAPLTAEPFQVEPIVLVDLGCLLSGENLQGRKVAVNVKPRPQGGRQRHVGLTENISKFAFLQIAASYTVRVVIHLMILYYMLYITYTLY